MKSPELSFGNKNQAWMAISFCDAFEFLNNKAISRSQLNYDEGEVKSVHYGDILTKFPQVLDSAYPLLPYVNVEIDVSKVSLLKAGDVAIADTAEDYMVGKAIEISISDDSQLVAGLHVMACRPKINFAPGFLGYYLNSNAFHMQLRKLVTGTKVFAINKSEIRKTKLSFPDVEEQQKIAAFFTALDEKIQNARKKLALTLKMKRAMIRDILAREVGFSSSSDWRDVTLGDVSSMIKTRKNSEFLLYVGTEDLIKDFGGLNKVKKEDVSGIHFEKGDILISNIRPYLKKLWMSDEEGIASTDVIVYRPKNIEPSLLKHILSTDSFFEHVAQGYKGSKMPRGDKSQMATFAFQIPSDEKEQKQIAIFLNFIEKKIACLREQEKALQKQKQAFMQQMFV